MLLLLLLFFPVLLLLLLVPQQRIVSLSRRRLALFHDAAIHVHVVVIPVRVLRALGDVPVLFLAASSAVLARLRLAVRLPHPLGHGRAVVRVFLRNRRGVLGECGYSRRGFLAALLRHLLGRGC